MEILGVLFCILSLVILVICIFVDGPLAWIIAISYIAILIISVIVAIKIDKKKRMNQNDDEILETEDETFEEEERKRVLNFENKKNKKDNKIDSYGLEEWQKKLVEKGEYKPWDFEEEDTDEDSYFHEDDK